MTRGTVATTRLALGPCDCPDTPHAKGDYADVKARFDWGDLRALAGANSPYRLLNDPQGAAFVAAERAIVTWNLVEAGGTPLPITAASIETLDPRQGAILRDHFNAPGSEYARQIAEYFEGRRSEAGPPNPSGGPSPDGSAEPSAPTTSSLASASSPALEALPATSPSSSTSSEPTPPASSETSS